MLKTFKSVTLKVVIKNFVYNSTDSLVLIGVNQPMTDTDKAAAEPYSRSSNCVI